MWAALWRKVKKWVNTTLGTERNRDIEGSKATKLENRQEPIIFAEDTDRGDSAAGQPFSPSFSAKFPGEIWDNALRFLDPTVREEFRGLLSCCLVSKLVRSAARPLLLRKLVLTHRMMARMPDILPLRLCGLPLNEIVSDISLEAGSQTGGGPQFMSPTIDFLVGDSDSQRVVFPRAKTLEFKKVKFTDVAQFQTLLPSFPLLSQLFFVSVFLYPPSAQPTTSALHVTHLSLSGISFPNAAQLVSLLACFYNLESLVCTDIVFENPLSPAFNATGWLSGVLPLPNILELTLEPFANVGAKVYFPDEVLLELFSFSPFIATLETLRLKLSDARFFNVGERLLQSARGAQSVTVDLLLDIVQDPVMVLAGPVLQGCILAARDLDGEAEAYLDGYTLSKSEAAAGTKHVRLHLTHTERYRRTGP